MWSGLALVVVVCIGGCIRPQASQCSDGRICEAGTLCIAGQELCVAPDQLAACATSMDGDHCVATGIPLGICSGGVCLSSGCGNGRVDPGEACDDGNTTSGDGCSADCASRETCGNTIMDVDEQCDCGTATDVRPGCTGPNSDTSGLCSLSCHLRCGDGVVSPDEGCDPGASAAVSCPAAVYDRGITTCSASCQPVSSADTCRFIGWRTRGTQVAMTPIVGLAPTGAAKGYMVSGNQINRYVNYASVGTATVVSTTLRAMWALDDDTAFAVGDGGLIVQRVSPGWREIPNVPSANLHAVWGRSATDVYALGDASALHWDGTSWTTLPPPPAGHLHALTGDAVRIYIAGDAGKLYSYDGASWQTIDTGTLQDLRGVAVAPGLLVAVGLAGTIVEDDGTGWRPGRTLATADLLSVAGDTTHGFYAAGTHGTLLGYDGHVWRPLSLGRGVTGPSDQTFFSVGVSPYGVGALGSADVVTFEGAAWSPVAVPAAVTLYALWASAPDDVFAVGRGGTILHHDGLRWTLQPTPSTADLRSVWGTGPTDVYAVGDASTLLHFDGAAWSALPVENIFATFEAVFALSPGDIVLAAKANTGSFSSTGIFRDEMGALVRTSSLAVQSLWGSSPTDLFAAGPLTRILHFDGTSWSPQSIVTMGETSLAGTSSHDLYALGVQGLHFDGMTWTVGPFDDPGLVSVATAVPGAAFAVGHEGRLRHWDGTVVEPLVSRTNTDLNAVFVSGPVVFMAGVDGTLDVMLFRE